MTMPLPAPRAPSPAARAPRWPEVISELQAVGLRWDDAAGLGLHRIGGAGPSDHKAITVAGQTVMVPVVGRAPPQTPYSAVVNAGGDGALLYRHGAFLARIGFPREPRFYRGATADGVPYWKIATLHGEDVLASTVLQTCTRYGNRATSCQFCAIGQSLAARATIPEKTPAQLAEVARAAVELDGVAHAVLTTGTPATPDRGAAVLAACAAAMKAAVPLAVQVQCEPPDDHGWFQRLRDAGADALGMHLEAVTEEVRRRIMPGKAELPVSRYFEAFAAAVEVFGRGQVSTYVLAGLGDSRAAILDVCEALIELGVYPFVVPFVPLAGTPLQGHPRPDPAFIGSLLADLARLLALGGLRSDEVKAGCARCGACSSLRAREALSRA